MPAIQELASKVTRGVMKKTAKAEGKQAVAQAAKALSKDSLKGAIALTPAVQGLVDMAKMAAGAGNKEMAEKSFVNAAAASQGILVGTDKGLAQTLGVARIAAATENSGNASRTILVNLKDKFTGFGEREQIAATAKQLGHTDVQHDILKYLASFPPSTTDAIRLADGLSGEHGLRPLVSQSLDQGLRRATTFKEINALQMAALKHGDSGLFEASSAVSNRLIEQGHTGAGEYGQQIAEVLRELGK